MTEAKQTFDVPKLPVQHQQHQDLMKRWSGPQRHVSADPNKSKQSNSISRAPLILLLGFRGIGFRV